MNLHAMFLISCLSFLGLEGGQAGNDKPVIHEGIVKGSVKEVWTAFTTKEGIQSWMVPIADIDLKVGGLMRTSYNPKGKIGDKGTIENTILSYHPHRMLSIRATKAPESFPFKNAIQKMWTVIYLTPVGENQTKVEVISMGFTEDEESQKMRKHFDFGNAYTLKKLQERFEPKPASPAKAK